MGWSGYDGCTGSVAERPNALVLKTSEGYTSGGSNPSTSAVGNSLVDVLLRLPGVFPFLVGDFRGARDYGGSANLYVLLMKTLLICDKSRREREAHETAIQLTRLECKRGFDGAQ